MDVLKKIDDVLSSIDSQDFYKYMGAVLAGVTILLALVSWRYYSTTRYYLAEIQGINEQRETKVKTLFESNERVIAEQKQVDALLDKDPNFKIRQHFDEIVQQLGLASKRVTDSISPVERENYRESVLTVSFAGMNMQELCELLQALERVQRIFSKSIDIQRSKKIPDAIDVTLVIATLLPKTG